MNKNNKKGENLVRKESNEYSNIKILLKMP